MIYYFIILILLVCHRMERKKYCIFATTLLSLFAGLRGNNVGADTVQYQYIFDYQMDFDSITSLLLFRAMEDKAAEVGYTLLMYFVHMFASYDVFKFICSALCIVPAGYIIYKRSFHPTVSFLLFYSMPIFTLLSMSAQRQGIAFGISLIALDFCVQKKWKPFILLILLASLFHNTVAVLLTLYFINKIDYKRKYNLLIIIGLLVVFMFRSAIFSVLNSYSRIDYEVGDAGGVGMMIFLFLIFATSLLVPQQVFKDEFNKFQIYLLVFTIACWFIGMNLAAIFRLAAYTEFFICLYVSNVLAFINKNITRKVVTALICIGMVAVMQRIALRPSSDNVNTYVPYTFNWEK